MGKMKPFGVALGLLGNIMIGLALNQLIQIGSCGGYRPACPSEATPYFVMLPVGILTSVAAMFLGGGALVFVGIFFSIGVGALAAAFGSEDSDTRGFGFLFGGIFASVPVLLLLFGLGGSRLGRSKAVKAQHLIATGAKGVGTRASRSRCASSPRTGSSPFDAHKTVTVSRVAIPRAGDRFPVWYDCDDPATWAYGTDMNASVAPAEIQALFARAAQSAQAQAQAQAQAPAAPVPATVDHGPADEPAKLNDLRLAGVLTDAEFETAKARLLRT